ncbi:MAG: restriction endonuclease [Chloroflexus sp.]|uniref:restriction endonuclease subunit S n=1 Tax=Chloroflexus sp. TaxID=1904827 RepID=UPI0021DC7D13|nr:restriction endonuclease subunit S [Chloroflexus sp.]GIV89161.1 MAG: restriction endonuclease [Chloroflexus sp.]
MESEWPKVRLGDVVSINPDSIGSDWPFPYIKYIDISSLDEGALVEPPQVLRLDEAPSRAKRLVHEGDTVLSTVRPGRRSMFFVKQPDPEWVVSTGFAVLRPRREYIEPRYLYACVFDRSFTEFLVQREKGAAYPAVLPEDIAEAVIKLPPLPEQRAIAHILGTLDDKIELNRRMSETLEAMARALFKAWFVDFEPVRTKMDGRWKRGQSLPGLPAHLYDLFPDRLVDSELGEIPEGWEVGSFLEMVDILSGGTPSTSIPEYWNGEVPWVSAKDVGAANGSFLLSTEKTITISGVQNSSTKILPAYTTIITARGTVGSYCLLGIDMAINQTNYGIRGKNGVGSYFVFFSVAEMVEHLRQHAYGTIFDTITTKTFQDAKSVKPPQSLLAIFERYVEPLMGRVLSNEQVSRTLAGLRDALLPKLISGALRVKDAERFLEERGL